MKRIYKTGLLILIISAGFLNAKAATADDTSHNNYLYSNPAMFSASAELQTGTSGLNQYVINRLIFGGYISPDRIKEAGKLQHSNNRLGFYSAGNLTHYIPNRKKYTDEKMHVVMELAALEYSNILGAKYSLGAYNITFRGNGDYLGQTMNLGKSSVDQFATRTIKVGLKTFKQHAPNEFHFAVGLSQLASYRKMRIKNGSVFTDSVGSSVDASVNGYMDNTGRAGVLGHGIGTVVDFNWVRKNSKKKVFLYKLGFDNLGIYYIPSLNHYSKQMNTPAHFSQLDINFSNLGNSGWITSQRDTFNRALQPDSSKTSKWVMSPFHLFAKLYIKKIEVNFDYRYITGYLPSVTLQRAMPFDIYKGLKATPSLQLGGFDTYNINLALSYKMLSNNKWYAVFTLKCFGMEALAGPRITHGTGIFLGVNFMSSDKK